MLPPLRAPALPTQEISPSVRIVLQATAAGLVSSVVIEMRRTRPYPGREGQRRWRCLRSACAGGLDPLQSTLVLTALRVRQLLEPFGLDLSATQLAETITYADLLLRWNQKINLTAIRDPEECVRRLFGESLFLARHAELSGSLLDIGSGAGFPGLALKIAVPTLSVTLLEPVAKKRAFLKEAARTCGFHQVEVRSERLDEFVRGGAPSFDSATSRAVGKLESLIPLAAECLKPGGSIYLWMTRDPAAGLAGMDHRFSWRDPLPIPLTREGLVLEGVLA